MRIIFVRHGQTVYNSESRYQGHSDTELSDLGRRQAGCAAERLKGEKITAIYTSDLKRAKDTAKAIAVFHNVPVQSDPRLRECCFGDWEGLTVSEITERYTEHYQNYRNDSVTNRAPNGERLESLQERVVSAIDEIVERHPDETVAVVVHGGPIRAFICHALGTDLRTFRKMSLENCSITTFSLEPNGRWFLESLNDACHLGKLRV